MNLNLFKIKINYKLKIKIILIFLMSFFIINCTQKSFESISSTTTTSSESTDNNSNEPSTNNTTYQSCSNNFITSAPCLVEKTGSVVTKDFGENITVWLNPLASNEITSSIPNGFYANHEARFTDSDLISQNIKVGTSIFGVSGNLIEPYTSCTNNSLIANQSLCTANLNSFITSASGSNISTWFNSTGTTLVSVSIPDGFYSGKSVSFTETNLLASNIITSATIFGVAGTAMPLHAPCSTDSLNLSPCSTLSNSYVTSSSGQNITNWTNTLASTTLESTFTQGFYLGKQVVFSEPQLKASNIVSTATIFGVAGSAEAITFSPLVFLGVTSATNVLSTTAIIDWTGISGVTSYLVFNTNTNPPTLLTSVDGTKNRAYLFGLTPNTNYKIKVVALNEFGQPDTNNSELSITTTTDAIPSDISNLVVWFKSESLLSSADNEHLLSWSDSSSNAYNLTQGSSFYAPQVKWNTIGNYPVIQFNGKYEYMSISNTSYATNNFTVFVVAKPLNNHQIDAESTSGTPGIEGQNYLIDPTNQGTNAGAGISFGTNGISVYEHGSSYMPPLAVVSTTFTQFKLVTLSYASKVPSLYLNGSLVRTGLTSPKSSVYGPYRIGSITNGAVICPPQGQIAELIIFSRTLNSTERQQVETYLMNKFGLN